MRKSLTKEEILRNKKDIAELFGTRNNEGQASRVLLRAQADGLKFLLLLKRGKGRQAVFIGPLKSLGNAVHRNRAKRLAREFYRHSKQELRNLALAAAHRKWGSARPSDGFLPEDSLADSLEDSCDCHLGIVIYRPPSSESPLPKHRFKAEWHRYQVLFGKLEQALQAI